MTMPRISRGEGITVAAAFNAGAGYQFADPASTRAGPLQRCFDSLSLRRRRRKAQLIIIAAAQRVGLRDLRRKER